MTEDVTKVQAKDNETVSTKTSFDAEKKQFQLSLSANFTFSLGLDWLLFGVLIVLLNLQSNSLLIY